MDVSLLELETAELDTPAAEVVEWAVLGLVSEDEDFGVLGRVCSSYVLTARRLSFGLLLSMAGHILGQTFLRPDL